MSEENEPVITDVPIVEPTPEPAAIEPILEQPAEVIPEPVVDEEKETLKATNKRLKEQMHGWKQKAEENEAALLIKRLSPDPVIPATPIEEQVFDTPAPQPQSRNNALDKMTVINSIHLAKSMVEKNYRNDPILQWSDSVEEEAEREIMLLDPTGVQKLNPRAWDQAYLAVRGRKAEEQLKQLKNQKSQEVAKREKTKEVASIAVTPVTKPTVTPSKPTYEDVKTGKVKMSAAEMLKNFPEEVMKTFWGT